MPTAASTNARSSQSRRRVERKIAVGVSGMLARSDWAEPRKDGGRPLCACRLCTIIRHLRGPLGPAVYWGVLAPASSRLGAGMEPAWQARYNPRADHVEEVWQGHLDLASRWEMNDVVSSLDKYAAGQIDVTDLQRLLAHQLASAPDTAPSILAAIAAAERAGKIRTNDSRALGDWVRSTTLAPKNPSTSVGQPPGDPTVMRAPTQPEASAPPTAPKAPTPAPASPGQDRTEAVREGAVLKNRYLLEKRIGAGGMGVVFRARDLEQQRIGGEKHTSAIRLRRRDFGELRDALRSRYEEARKTRELAHPNIVGVYDCQQE